MELSCRSAVNRSFLSDARYGQVISTSACLRGLSHKNWSLHKKSGSKAAYFNSFILRSKWETSALVTTLILPLQFLLTLPRFFSVAHVFIGNLILCSIKISIPDPSQIFSGIFQLILRTSSANMLVQLLISSPWRSCGTWLKPIAMHLISSAGILSLSLVYLCIMSMIALCDRMIIWTQVLKQVWVGSSLRSCKGFRRFPVKRSREALLWWKLVWVLRKDAKGWWC